MVRENMSDHKVICSSIAMLQERFRQLEKLKEMREERELLNLISFSSNKHQCKSYYDNQSLTSNFYEPSKYIFHSEIIFPTQPFDSQLLSLTLWPNSQTKKCADSFWDINIENTQKLSSKPSWLTNVPLASPTLIKNADESSDNCDVDTTLHL